MTINYKIVGNRIQSKRRMKGITQEAMAEALNFSVGFISQLERGITKPSLDSLYDIACYLGCSTSELVDMEKYHETAYQQVEFNTMYEALPARDQQLFFCMLEVYVNNRGLIK